MSTRFSIERADNGGYILTDDSLPKGYINHPAAAFTSAGALLDWLRTDEKSPLKADLKASEKELAEAMRMYVRPGTIYPAGL